MAEKDGLQEIIERLIVIETKLDSFSEAKRKIYDNEKDIIILKNDIESLKKNINELINKNTWLFRTTIGALITGGISILLTILISSF